MENTQEFAASTQNFENIKPTVYRVFILTALFFVSVALYAKIY